MSIVAGKSVLPFEAKMAVLLDAVATNDTPKVLRPTLGPLAQLQYKPCRFKYLVRLSSAPTSGAANIELVAGETVVFSQSVSLNGLTEIANDVAVDLSQVAGETELKTRVDVTATADAGITAEVDSALAVETPVSVTGC